MLVIGGGIIGCAVAYFLRRAGAAVTLLERGEIAGEASGAAAGLLILPDRASAPGSFRDLCLASLDLYRELVARIESESGIDVRCLAAGILVTAETAERVPILRSFARRQRDHGFAAEWLDPPELRLLAPALSRSVLGAVYAPDELNVDPGLMTNAIARAAEKAGVTLKTGADAGGFVRSGGRLRAVRTSAGTFEADAFVLAAGPWTGALTARLGVPLRTPPMRGQMIAYRSTALRQAVWGDEGYLVPKTGGFLYAGATVEDVGFRKQTTARGLAGLRGMASRLVPSLRRADVASTWAGLRPGSPDGLPIIGRLPGYENVYVASGHFRNGILLAPITGKLIAQLVLEGRLDPLLAAFGAERFGGFDR